MSWTPPAMRRHEALAEYLVRLGLAPGDGSPTHQVPEVLSLAGHCIELEPWERTLLQESFGGESTRGRPWAPLLAEGLAFQMKCLARLEPRALHDDGSPYLPVQLKLDALITDAAVGLALLQETQRAIDQMVVAGEIAEAKRLTAFRNKLGQTVARLRAEIGEAEFPRAEDKAEGMVTPAETKGTLVSRSVGPDPGSAGQTWNGKRKSDHVVGCGRVTASEEKSAEPRSRLGPLTGLLVVLTIVWAVFILPKLTAPEPHILETAEFTDVRGIVSTVARPPTVYITVEAGLWGGMSRQDRKAMIVDIGEVADEKGYIGADIRDDSGKVIGRWLKARGAALVNP